MDILTLEKLFEREYVLTGPKTSQEVISYYAQVVAQQMKLPSQFAALAPKIREFLRYAAFGREVDLNDREVIGAISRRLTMTVTVRKFMDALRERIVQPQEPVLDSPPRPLGAMSPFPWGQITAECRKTVFNKVPCDNKFEETFARFLDRAMDVERFSKLPIQFGFSIPYTDTAGNLRLYYPDFLAVTPDGTHYVIETKGREDTDVQRKDMAAVTWCTSATVLTGTAWRYLKVLQKDYEGLQPVDLSECVYYSGMNK